MHKFFLVLILTLGSGCFAQKEIKPIQNSQPNTMADISNHNVVYRKAGTDSKAAMPTGNGDLGINVWTENERDIVVLIARSDAWDENSIICKIGKLRITVPGQTAFKDDINFSQTLHLKESEIVLRTSEDEIRIWTDAHQPIIRVESLSKTAKEITVKMESWRKTERPVNWGTTVGEIFKNLSGPDPYPTIMYPDTVVDKKDAIVWYHCNRKPQNDGFMINMELQGLGEFAKTMPHPLAGRTFGAWVQGDKLISTDNQTLKSKSPARKHSLLICSITEYPSTGEKWLAAAEMKVKKLSGQNVEKARKEHRQWWAKFWDRSHLFVWDKDKETEHLSQVYALQRYLQACGSRGEFPIKFNGGMWTYLPVEGKDGQDWDYRLWGNGYWWQNQRLDYWSMYSCGDFDLMENFFRIYDNALPMAKARTQKYFGHAGAHFPETIFWWGASVSGHYGWTPFENRTNPSDECPYTTYYWQNMLERVVMMYDYWLYTGDEAFAKKILMPHAEEMTLFYDLHYPRRDGKIFFAPAASLETWHKAENPTPEIAGLRYILPKLMELPAGFTTDEQLKRWNRMLGELPPIPMRQVEGQTIIAPAVTYSDQKNYENPELYAVFPYRIYGVGKKDLEVAQATVKQRQFKQTFCWCQNEIHQAYTGMADEAKKGLLERAGMRQKGAFFPAYWPSNYDWTPDLDHGANLKSTLQLMLMQCEGDKIYLLPAWPKEWNADFKLHAPLETVIEGKVIDGRIVDLKVTPQTRLKDVLIIDP